MKLIDTTTGKTKKYGIKPEYLDDFGDEAYSFTIIKGSDVDNLARGWDVEVSEVLEMLYELDDEDVARMQEEEKAYYAE